MKKRRLLLPIALFASLTLSGCDFIARAGELLPWINNETEQPADQGGGDEGGGGGILPPAPTETARLLGDEIEEFFAENDIEVEIPDYVSYQKDAYVDVDESVKEYGILFASINYSSNEEMKAYIEALENVNWAIEDVQEDGSCCAINENNDLASIYITDFTNPEDLEEGEEPCVFLMFIAEEPEPIDDGKLHYTFESSEGVEEADEGVIHQIKADGHTIDLLGYEETESGFGSIKEGTYGSYKYNGMIYNRSLFDNLASISVTYTGGSLYYKFEEFLMEDMDFDGAQELVSGEKVVAPSRCAYFVIYTNGEEASVIEKLDIACYKDESRSMSMIFDKTSAMGGARSNAKSVDLQEDLVVLENDPTKTTNNYSVGKTSGHKYNDTWYRWNGRYFANSEVLGTDFTFAMTIIGDYSRMIDESKYFHYNVWPQFAYENCFVEDGGQEDKSNTYAQTYIGNDNYEPLGKENALHPNDPYVNQSYTGRFFTDYGYDEALNDWAFLNPDTNTIEGDENVTFREAYNAYNLPFWHLEFHVYLDTEGVYAWEGEDPQPVCEISINGFKLYTYTIFEHYDMENPKDIYIYTMPMHLVNYGIDAEGNPGESYKGSFTYPRLVD